MSGSLIGKIMLTGLMILTPMMSFARHHKKKDTRKWKCGILAYNTEGKPTIMQCEDGRIWRTAEPHK